MGEAARIRRDFFEMEKIEKGNVVTGVGNEIWGLLYIQCGIYDSHMLEHDNSLLTDHGPL